MEPAVEAEANGKFKTAITCAHYNMHSTPCTPNTPETHFYY